MAGTLNELYLKYVEGVGQNIESDRYFQYLYQMIQAGDNEISQQHQVLHKVVDERWLSTIEEVLDPLSRIIDKPRRFIERVEEVVPVSLAKKITADSVRHLSMNTQFIAGADEDNIQPTRILNVSVEESYDLYENRFIYHLIQRLVTFVDKRTDVIFWSTADETQNTMTLKTHIDDAYEQIDYKVEMKVKNLQSYAENDSDNMEVFMRIDRVRRLVMSLRNSSFCQIMAGCQKVRSPIQRTNLLTKDPGYRKCYQLWGFLESYDEVGYSIEVQNSALEFDEEYLLQLHTNLIENYTVFKSITEGDRRDMDEMTPQRKRVIKPRFLKKIQEEVVDDYDIPEVEVKQVIVEEVTEAQLELEKKLQAEIEAREDVERALREAEAGAHHSMIQAEYAMSAKNEAEAITKEAEERVAELEAKLDKEREARDDMLLQLQDKDESILALKEQLGVEAVEYIKQLDEQRINFQEQIAEINNKHELDFKELRSELQSKAEDTELSYVEKMDELEGHYTQKMEALEMLNEERISETAVKYEEQLEKQSAAHAVRLAERQVMYDQAITKQQQEFEKSMVEQRKALKEEMAAATEGYIKQLSDKEAELAQVKTAAEEQLRQSQSQAERLLAETKEAAAQTLAEEKSAAGRKYSELEASSNAAMDQLKREKDQELADAKAEALAELARQRDEAEQRLSQASQEASDKYEALVASSAEEVAQAKQKAKEDISTTRHKAELRETELNATIARLEAEKRTFETDYGKLEKQLKEAIEARVLAEAKATAAAHMRAAAEDKARATTVSEFRSAVRAERKAEKLAAKEARRKR